MKISQLRLPSWLLIFAISICAVYGFNPQDDLRLSPKELAELGSSGDLAELQRFLWVIDVKARRAEEDRAKPTEEFLDMVFSFTRDPRQNIAFSYDEFLGSVRGFAITRLARLTNYRDVLDPGFRERKALATTPLPDPLNPVYTNQTARREFLRWYQEDYRGGKKLKTFNIAPTKEANKPEMATPNQPPD